MPLSLITIPLIVLAAAVSGNMFTSSGMEWYATINIPAWTPPGAVIGAVWTFIYITAGTAGYLALNSKKTCWGVRKIAISIFLVNAVLNAAWSWVFLSALNRQKFQGRLI